MFDILLPTIGRIGFLFFLIVVGWLLSVTGVLPKGSSTVLAKLEYTLFVPALVMATFMKYFTPAHITSAWKVLLVGTVTLVASIPFALICARICGREDYTRKIYTYGLAFSSFGFMGNAVIGVLFPGCLPDYVIFTIPFWILVYLWGVPAMLVPGSKKSLGSQMKALFNPMFVGMLLGIAFGLFGFPLPGFVGSAVSVAAECMSPIAMLLIGVAAAGMRFGDVFGKIGVWAVSLIRLLLVPVIAIIVLIFVPISHALEVCIVTVLCMPLGLNAVIVPTAYGKNATAATSMALISHLLSAITIPLVFWLMGRIL